MTDPAAIPTGDPDRLTTRPARPTWPVFICYRQVDGKDAARWLAEKLDGQVVPFVPDGYDVAPALEVYFDQTAPAVPDWTKVHQPALERARAFLVVCSPAAKIDEGANDWVQKELNWWIENRTSAPLVIDSTGQGERYIPAAIANRWPQAQRTLVQPNEWARLPEEARRPLEESALKRILGGISASEVAVRYEDLERERERTRILGEQRDQLQLQKDTLEKQRDSLAQLGRRLRRQRAGLAIVLVAACLAAGLAVYQWQQQRRAAERARAQAALVAARGSADPAVAALLLAELPLGAELDQAAAVASEIAQRVIPLVILRGHNGHVVSASFSPDGTRVLTASSDGTARVWRSDGTGQPVIFAKGKIESAAFSPDGMQIVTAGFGGPVRVWRADGAGQPVELKGHINPDSSAAFSPDGTHVVAASMDGLVHVWRADGTGDPVVLSHNREPLLAERRARLGVASAAFSPDGSQVVTVTRSFAGAEHVWIWRADGAADPVTLRVRGATLTAEFSPDGTRVVTGELEGARVWPTRTTGDPLLLPQASVRSASFSPDGTRVVAASVDGTTRVWRADGTGEPIVLRGHAGPVSSAAFSSDGARLVTASEDRTARIWRADGAGTPVELTGHEGLVRSAVFSRDGTRVVTASDDGTARIWRVDGASEPVRLRDPSGGAEEASKVGLIPHFGSAAFSADGTRLVTTAPLGNAAWVWRADGTGDPVVLRGHAGPVSSAAFSPNGALVVTASADRTARVWRVDGTADPVVLRGHDGSVESVAFSPDGVRVITASSDGTARVWRADGKENPVVLRHTGTASGSVRSAAFSSDGSRVITVTSDSVRVWRADGPGDPLHVIGSLAGSVSVSRDGMRVAAASKDGARILRADGSGEPVELRGHGAPVWDTAFSPDGMRVVTASRDGTARVWRADGSGQAVVLRGHGDVIYRASFSSDGARVVTASRDGTARVWRADGSGQAIVLRGHAGIVGIADFSPDGSRVVTIPVNGLPIIWRVGWGALVDYLARSTTACLSVEQRVSLLLESGSEPRAAHDDCERRYGRVSVAAR